MLKFLSETACFAQLVLHVHNVHVKRQPSTSVKNTMNLWTFCFRVYLCSWRDSLPCDAHSLDRNLSYSNVYFYASHTYFAPFLCFLVKGLFIIISS